MQYRNVAIEVWCICLAISPGSVRAQDEGPVAHFENLIKAENFTEAKTALDSYVAAHPKSWQALYQLGYVDFRLHLIQPSLDLLSKSLVLNPRFAEAHKILAYDLNILGRQDLAVRELEQAVEYDPQSSESYYELGRIYYEQGSYLDAIKYLEKAKTLAPEFVRVYHNLGLAYAGVADYPKAVENFEAGLRLNAQQAKPSAWPLIDYGTYFNLRSEFARARDMLLEAIKIDKLWDQEFGELSKAYRGLGQPEEAISALKEAITLNPYKPEYHYVLAALYRQTNRAEEAKEELAEYARQKNQQHQ